MLTVSSGFLSAIKQASRTVSAKIEIDGSTLYEEDIISFSIEQDLGDDGFPSVGSTPAKKLVLEILDTANTPSTIIGTNIRPWIGIDVSGTVEWLDLGLFVPQYDDVVKTKRGYKIECLDAMPDLDTVVYGSALTYPASVKDILDEIHDNFGYNHNGSSHGSVMVPVKLTGTLRQVVSKIATIIGAVAHIKNNAINFHFTATTGFTLDDANYRDFKLLAENQQKISQMVILKSDPDVDVIYGDTTGVAISYTNEGITNATELQSAFDRVYPLTFWTYECNLQGMPHIEAGDIITLTDTDAVSRDLIIGSHTLTYNGGLTSTFRTTAPKADGSYYSSTGTSILTTIPLQYYDVSSIATSVSKTITGANGGNVLINTNASNKPFEILIMDTEDVNTAQNIWRWNSGGLGFSSTGYNGTYSTAITNDGKISASFISAGQMNANVITSGILKSANDSSWINLNDGTFNLGGGRVTDSDINYAGTSIETALGTKASQTDMNRVNLFMNFDDTAGLTLGKSFDNFKVNISNTKLSFLDGSTEVAYVSGQKMYITEANVTTEMVVGNHSIKKYDNNITVVNFIG